ncbi:MAG: glutamine synthetase family protein [Actinomycetia bacterium]|nr:glutamine synthetase family protein [Actinomycetes bacterium]
MTTVAEAPDRGIVIGTIVNPAGLTLAKVVPADAVERFADPGLGASPTWHGFAIDRTGIAFTDAISVVGDERLRIDRQAMRAIGDGLAWGPASFFDQDGNPVPTCTRGTLGRIESRLKEAGLRALVGHEIEFLLVDPSGNRLPGQLWAQYGLAGVLEHESFVRDVMAAMAAAGVAVEQFHPEYGVNQFEMSLAPASPVAAADQLVLARIVIARVARDHGMRVSLSPVPFAGSVGSGAHQHVSLLTQRAPLFSGGRGPRGLTPEGAAAIGGVISGLVEAQLIFAGSIVSGLRMRPGNWAGAYVCWGTENREAAVRFLPESHGNPRGANIEVKVVDPSANPYLASAAILGLALDGIERGATLPPEIRVDPQTLPQADRDAAGASQLSHDQADAVAALDGSHRLRVILGDPVVDALVAVRRFELQRYAELSAEDSTDKFRMAWSL